MWPMGHVAIAYLCLVCFDRFQGRTRPDDAAAIIVVFGALFPDLIDKPLAWYLGVLPTGRSLGHSLVFLIPLCIVIGILAWRFGKPIWGIAFAIGSLSHTLVDALPVLWRDGESAGFLFWPLVSLEGYGEEGSPSVIVLLTDSMTDPYFLIEFPLLAIAVIVWVRQGMPGISTIRTILERNGRETRFKSD